MPLTLKPEGGDKSQLAVSLAALLLSDSKIDITAENLQSVLTASGVEVPAYFPTLYAAFIEKAGGVDKFMAGPSAGGAAPAPAGGAAPAAAEKPKEAEKPKVEEVDALEGGISFGASSY